MVFSKRNRRHVPCFYRVIQTIVKVWENSKKLWTYLSAARVPTAFLVLPNFHLCFYSSIETRYMFSIFLNYSCGLSHLAYECGQGGDLALIQNSPLFLFTRKLISIRRVIYTTKTVWSLSTECHLQARFLGPACYKFNISLILYK